MGDLDVTDETGGLGVGDGADLPDGFDWIGCDEGASAADFELAVCETANADDTVIAGAMDGAFSDDAPDTAQITLFSFSAGIIVTVAEDSPFNPDVTAGDETSDALAFASIAVLAAHDAIKIAVRAIRVKDSFFMDNPSFHRNSIPAHPLKVQPKAQEKQRIPQSSGKRHIYICITGCPSSAAAATG